MTDGLMRIRATGGSEGPEELTTKLRGTMTPESTIDLDAHAQRVAQMVLSARAKANREALAEARLWRHRHGGAGA